MPRQMNQQLVSVEGDGLSRRITWATPVMETPGPPARFRQQLVVRLFPSSGKRVRTGRSLSPSQGVGKQARESGFRAFSLKTGIHQCNSTE